MKKQQNFILKYFLWDQITKTIDLVLRRNVFDVAIAFFSSVPIGKYAQKSK